MHSIKFKREAKTYKLKAPTSSECALGSENEGKGICSNELSRKAMRAYVKSSNKNESDEAILRQSKKKANVQSESELYYNVEFQNQLKQFAPHSTWKSLLEEYFNPAGPFDTVAAISDSEEIAAMRQWTKTSVGSAFYPIPFQLLDFVEIEDSELRNFDWLSKLQQGYRTFGVLVNTATVDIVNQCSPSGPCGLHWFALFFDFRSLGDAPDFDQLKNSKFPYTKSCTVEFFNSSGNSPRAEIDQYFKVLQKQFQSRLPGINLWFVTASLLRQQYGDTECGMYCLYYIYHRLNGIPFTYFLTTHIADDEVTAFRPFVFRHDRLATRQ